MVERRVDWTKEYGFKGELIKGLGNGVRVLRPPRPITLALLGVLAVGLLPHVPRGIIMICYIGHP